ncbi:MAG: hypothetical protein LUI09_05820 [Prevotellaceae bacterium]|nr:hypothetical protein [Prevotellaceae bacterium]
MTKATVNLRNPLIWLRRLPHRNGYGVHSPFAYDLLTEVIYSPGRYYDYAPLDAQFTQSERLLSHRRVAVNRLLFRLANRWQPQYICALGANDRQLNYLHKGCSSATFTSKTSGKAELVYLGNSPIQIPERVPNGSMLVIDHLQQRRELWQELLLNEQASITFDLYDVGIVIFDRKFQQQHYVINW